MSDLDNLRPEVRGALEVIAGEAVCTCHEAYTSRGMKDPACNHDLKGYVDTIRAELLRLADECDKQTHKVIEWRDKHDKLQAELAALKTMVEKATVGVLGVCFNGHEPAFVGFPDRFEHDSSQDLIGCRVALVKVDNELTGEHADSMEEWARRKVEE